jgi:hypothetical protein
MPALKSFYNSTEKRGVSFIKNLKVYHKSMLCIPNHHQLALVVLLHIIPAAIKAQAVAPSATYKLVLSGGGSSLFGNAVLGFVAASASVTNNSEILFHVTLTCNGAFIFRFKVYSSGCISDR